MRQLTKAQRGQTDAAWIDCASVTNTAKNMEKSQKHRENTVAKRNTGHIVYTDNTDWRDIM